MRSGVNSCAREFGIQTVAVYSDADKDSMHVQWADESVALGGRQSSENYLNIPKLIDAAKRSGAACVHPGYVFLSEDTRFASAVLRQNSNSSAPPLKTCNWPETSSTQKRV